MEELISIQLLISETFDIMHNLIENNLADLGELIEVYEQKSIDALHLLWKNFEDNDRILIEAPVKEDNYFTTKIFEKVEEEYLSVMSVLYDFVYIDVPLDDSPPKPFADIQRSQRDMLIGHQRLRFTNIEEEIKCINIDSIHETNAMEDWQKILKRQWKTIEKCHKIIREKYADMWLDLSYELDYVRYKNMYETTYSLFNYKIDAFLHPVFHVIPGIGIPTWRMFDNASDVHPFAVNSIAWAHFDNVRDVIHNNKFSEEEKRHILIRRFLAYQNDEQSDTIPENSDRELEDTQEFLNAYEVPFLLTLVYGID